MVTGALLFGGGDVFKTLVAWKEAAPAAGALVAIVSAFVALIVFSYTRRANRRRATLDMVMKTLLDESAQRKYRDFKTLVRRHGDADDPFKLESVLDPDTPDQDNREIILNQLNIYELTALGIRRRIFDEQFYKRWFHATFMKDYETAQAFIRKAQEKKASLYCEMSSLYNRWERAGHPVSNPNRGKLAYWAFTGQNEKLDRARGWSKAR
jgi:hypothetical protein